jgi:exoribonuclease R
MRFKIDDHGSPCELEAKAKLPMMDLIAEMMIWANAQVCLKQRVWRTVWVVW